MGIIQNWSFEQFANAIKMSLDKNFNNNIYEKNQEFINSIYQEAAANDNGICSRTFEADEESFNNLLMSALAKINLLENAKEKFKNLVNQPNKTSKEQTQIKNLTKRDLINILNNYPNNLNNVNNNQNIISDGIIGDFKQSSVTGDCYLLAALKSLSLTTEGSRILKDNIKKNINGSYEVSFPGAIMVKHDYKREGKQCFITGKYTITAAEIDKARKSIKYSRGDIDVLIYELAFEKYRKEVIKTNEANNQTSQYGEAGQFVGNDSTNLLNGGVCNDANFILTGKKTKVYSISPDNVESVSSDSIKSLSSIESNISQKNVNKLLDDFAKNPTRYSICFSLKLDNGTGKHGYHGLSLTKVEGGRIHFVNPWDTKEQFSMSRQDFFRTAFRIEIVDMKSSYSMSNVPQSLLNIVNNL